MKRKNIILSILFILMFGSFAFINVPAQETPYYKAVESVMMFGKGQFGSINNIYVSPRGIIYVSDASDRSIKAFNMRGEYLFSFGQEPGSKLQSIMELSSDREGNVYVADYKQDLVNIYNSKGKYLFNIKLETKLQKKLNDRGSSGVAINSRGDIYITDSANGRIEVRDNNRKYKFQIDKFKDKDGKELELISPTHPRINSHNELYVIDPLISKVRRFDAEGNYLNSFGYMGRDAGGFIAASGLVIDRFDRVYVIDSFYETIQVFNREGKFLYVLCDETGEKPYTPYPTGLALDNDDHIYIGCTDGGCGIKVFKYILPASEQDKESK